MGANYYAQAIQVLFDEKTDFKALAYEIAKMHPRAVVKASERIEIGFGWQRECKGILDTGGLLNAVKRCRELTGMSLKEAKDAVEALR